MSYFGNNWCGLNWTPWVSFSGSKIDWLSIPDAAGVYRVRPAGTNIVAYIGETGRSLRERLRDELMRNTMKDTMPFNDPHTAAPNLWAWRKEEDWTYECSAAPLSKSKAERCGLECLLLWKYRIEKGESTLCNHGRFHKNYTKSSNRKKNFRGYRLPEPELNAAGGRSHPPLRLHGHPLDRSWMEIQWSNNMALESKMSSQIPRIVAVYKIMDFKRETIVYIGESTALRNRFRAHCRSLGNSQLEFAFSKVLSPIQEFQLHEIENDLIAGYYDQTASIPIYQFSNTSRTPSH